MFIIWYFQVEKTINKNSEPWIKVHRECFRRSEKQRSHESHSWKQIENRRENGSTGERTSTITRGLVLVTFDMLEEFHNVTCWWKGQFVETLELGLRFDRNKRAFCYKKILFGPGSLQCMYNTCPLEGSVFYKCRQSDINQKCSPVFSM